jgi:pimeloyl-ACP methyl ester carboxylesterase/DNA-binding CsgD family transcriptional regulator
MDAPPVQYVKTSDGYDIAYTVSGEGLPLVMVPFHLSHVELDWHSNAATEPWMRGLSQRFRFVHYDPRGLGMSTRYLPPGLQRDAWLQDLEAVVDRVGFERFVLLGINIIGHIAIEYALHNPERVIALILMNCRTSVASWMAPLVQQSWDLFLQTQSPASTPTELREAEVARLRLAAKPTDFLVYLQAFSTSDVTVDLPMLAIPTLLLHGRDLPWFGPEQAAALAAQIPESRLVLLDGGIMPETSQALDAIDTFLRDLAPISIQSTENLRGGLSSRELEVLRLLAAGKSNAEIAEELVISQNTVIRHVSNIYAKTGAANRAQATAYAKDHGIA